MALGLEQGLEQRQDVLGGGIEAAIGALVLFDSAGTAMQQLLRGSRIGGHGQSREVVLIGRAGDLRIERQAGDALGHGEAADDLFAFVYAMTASEESIGGVDHGFDAQEQAELVVHLDPVLADAMLDTHAFDARLEVLEDIRQDID